MQPARTSPKPSWAAMLRDKEVRIVSGPPGAPYAMTVLQLSGQVVVQLDRRFWLETPGPVREVAIRTHVEQVREEIQGMRSPATLLAWAAFGVRGVLTLLGGGLTLGPDGPTLPAFGAFGLITAAILLTPRRWILRPVQVLVGFWIRRWLLRSAR